MRVRLLDAATLLYHAIEGSNHTDVGFEDADCTINEFRNLFNKEIHLNKSLVESALWSCFRLEEQGKYKHPDGLTAKEMANRIGKFNDDYCVFDRESEGSKNEKSA